MDNKGTRRRAGKTPITDSRIRTGREKVEGRERRRRENRFFSNLEASAGGKKRKNNT